MYLISWRWRHLKSLTSFTYAFVLRFREKKKTYHYIRQQVELYSILVPYQGTTTKDPRVCWTCALGLSDPDISPHQKKAKTILQSWNRMCFTSNIPISDLVLLLVI